MEFIILFRFFEMIKYQQYQPTNASNMEKQ